MFLSEFQTACTRTMNSLNKRDAILNYSIGIAGEAGEVANLVKKSVFHGHELDKQHLKEELGDVLFYVAALATTFNISLDDVADFNIEKLKKRYPDGFSIEASINRKL